MKKTEKRLVLLGAGGHCKSVLDAVLRRKQYNKIYITDPDILRGTSIMGCPVIGDDTVLPKLFQEGVREAFITVGSIKDTSLRYKLYHNAKSLGFTFPNIVDPSANVSAFATLEDGIFVGKNVIVNAGTSIGKMSILNSGSIVEHECVVGEFSHIAVGAVLCGNVVVGDHTFVGANATVIQGIKIGARSVIGAGSVVLGNVASSSSAFGLYKGETM